MIQIMSASRIAPDGTPRFAASYLGLFCSPMSRKKYAWLIWVNTPLQYTAIFMAKIFLGLLKTMGVGNSKKRHDNILKTT